jgi:hypothetical protein
MTICTFVVYFLLENLITNFSILFLPIKNEKIMIYE